jgi:predicted  nucleic acid-binding Zn-ribbon protein
MEALRKLNGTLTEERESLREAVDGHQIDVQDKETKTRELERQINEALASVESESATATQQTSALSVEREKLKAELSKPLVRRYEFISGRRPGRAVVPAREGRCTGCNLMLPPQLFNELQLNTKILQCTNCQRVLYFETEEEQKRASAG